MNQEPYQFEEEAYQIEAKIIAEYMLAGDKVLGDALRDAMKANVLNAMESIWTDKDIIAAFHKHLRSHLVEQAGALSGGVERERLDDEIAVALGKQWSVHFKDSVDHAVRIFIQQGGAQLSGDQKTGVSKGVNQASLEQLLEKAVRQALETHLEAGLKDAVLKSVETQLTEQQIRRITGDIVKGDLRRTDEKAEEPWSKQPVVFLGAPIILILILLVWGNMSNRSAINRLARNMGQASLAGTQTPAANETDLIEEDEPEERDAAPKPASAPAVNVLLDVWLQVMTADGSEPEGFQFVANNRALAFQAAFGFEDARVLKLAVAGGSGLSRSELFQVSPFLDLKDARPLAASITQKLVAEVARRKGDDSWAWLKTKEPAYLSGFKADGDFGAGSIALTKNFLTFLGEDASQYGLNRTGTKTSEFLLLSYLALEALAKP